MNCQSKASLVYQFENMRNTYKTVGITVSVLVALIGIMNFINAIITSINVRRRELAMLESIGMTGKQVMRMLTLESCLYILFTLIVTITVGSGICYLGLDAFTKSAAYMHLYFTVFPSIVCVPLLLLIAVVIPIICDKIVSKSSIVDRLRETE